MLAVRSTRITDQARDMARGSLCFGIQRSFTITHSHYKNIDLVMMSQGFTPIYIDAELDNIEKEVSPLVHDLYANIEDEIIPPRG